MINWLKAHRILMIIFSIIIALCIIISVSYIRGDLGIIGSGIQTVNSTIQNPISSVATGAEDGIKSIFKFKVIAAENEELKEEIASLEKELIALKLTRSELEEMRELEKILNYEPVISGKVPITANITAIDGSTYFNIFTIDRGSESEIKKDDIVVTGVGLVGKVLESGKNYSKIISIVDETTKVSFQTLRDVNIMGIVEGDGDGNLVGYTLDADAEIIEGDVLITSGIGIYPGGIEIGSVRSITFNQDTQLKTVEVNPSVSFKNLRKVTVLI